MTLRQYPKLLILSLLMVGCSNREKKVTVEQNIPVEVEDKQFKAILQNPDKFDSLEVEVIGTFTYEFENVAIYLTLKDSENWLSNRAFWVNEDDDSDSLLIKKFELFNHKKVRLKGRFDSNDKGHLSSYSGTINEVKDLNKVD